MVRVDGLVRDERLFRKTCAYIPQSDHLLPHLSVDEYLTVAARLKLGRGTSEAARQDIVSGVQFFSLLFHSFVRLSFDRPCVSVS